MRSAARWLGASLLLGGPLLACEDDTALSYDRAVAPPASWCSAMCSTYRRCQSGAWPSCLNECQAQNRAFLARMSEASLALQVDCIQRANCTETLDDLLDQCFADTFSALEPSAEATDLCTVMAKPFFECSWFATPQSCGTFHAVFSASALASERACAAASCEELEACVDAQLASFGE